MSLSHLSETTSFTLPLHEGQNVTLTHRSLFVRIRKQAYLHISHNRTLGSIHENNAHLQIIDLEQTYLSDITSVTSSSQNLIDDGKLDFVFLQEIRNDSIF